MQRKSSVIERGLEKRKREKKKNPRNILELLSKCKPTEYPITQLSHRQSLVSPVGVRRVGGQGSELGRYFIVQLLYRRLST